MTKLEREKEAYGELVNLEDKPTLIQRFKDNYIREYTKLFHVFKLKNEYLEEEFEWYHHWIKGNDNVRPFRIIGQINQDLLVVQRTDTLRYYRMPTREVENAFKYV